MMIQLANKGLVGDIRSLRLILEMIGPLSEWGRQVELEASYRESSTARESLAKKLDQLRERLRAGRVDDTDTK